jgi:hypothetical protein
MKQLIVFYLMVSVLSFLILSCSNNSDVAGIEITNGTGNCTGTIYNADSTLAAGAVVHLIPSGYNPSSPSGQIDSAVTNENGQYAFDVTNSDFYTILAQKGDASCMVDSVAIHAELKTIADGVLEVSGILKGTITVNDGDSPSDVIILIWGTNIYTAPDSTGHFQTPALPSGKFNVQAIFIKNSEYNPVDTQIEVTSAAATILDVTFEHFTVSYDSATMYSTLSWSPVDISKITYYSIYRDCVIGKDTVFMVNKKDTSFVDDLLFNENDTVMYSICAIGKNYKKGYPAISKPIVPYSSLILKEKNEIKEPLGGCDFKIDNMGLYTFQDFKKIKKFDQKGELLYSYESNENSIRYEWLYTLTDSSGNIYLIQNRSKYDEDTKSVTSLPPVKLVKLNTELRVVKEVELPDSFNDFSLLKGFNFSNQHSLNIKNMFHCVIVYDTSLNFISTYITSDNDSLFGPDNHYNDAHDISLFIPMQMRSMGTYSGFSPGYPPEKIASYIVDLTIGYQRLPCLLLLDSVNNVRTRCLLKQYPIAEKIDCFAYKNFIYYIEYHSSSTTISKLCFR